MYETRNVNTDLQDTGTLHSRYAKIQKREIKFLRFFFPN